jgi:hypothetical protein
MVDAGGGGLFIDRPPSPESARRHPPRPGPAPRPHDTTRNFMAARMHLGLVGAGGVRLSIAAAAGIQYSAAHARRYRRSRIFGRSSSTETPALSGGLARTCKSAARDSCPACLSIAPCSRPSTPLRVASRRWPSASVDSRCACRVLRVAGRDGETAPSRTRNRHKDLPACFRPSPAAPLSPLPSGEVGAERRVRGFGLSIGHTPHPMGRGSKPCAFSPSFTMPSGRGANLSPSLRLRL